MTRILGIDSSSRSATPEGAHLEESFSRALADGITAQLLLTSPDAHVLQRDLIAEPIAHIADETIKGYCTPPEAMTDALRSATAQSDALIAELRAADFIVHSAPIYSFSLPSAHKAWIDQIVRIGQIFAREDGRFSGLLSDRPVHLALSYGAGGYALGGPLGGYDFLRPYLIGRGVELSSDPPEALRNLVTAPPALTEWDARLTALSGVTGTHPPH